jgi:hypothetical protein
MLMSKAGAALCYTLLLIYVRHVFHSSKLTIINFLSVTLLSFYRQYWNSIEKKAGKRKEVSRCTFQNPLTIYTLKLIW